MRESRLKVFAGMSNEPLAHAIAAYVDANRRRKNIDTCLGKLDPRRHFNDGELYVRYDENIRGKDIIIVQSTHPPDSHFWELQLMIHTAEQASAGRITAVIPYGGYFRQDWKDKSRAPNAVALIARVIKAAGANRVLLLDAHSNVVSGAFAAVGVQTDHLWARPVFVRHLLGILTELDCVTVLAPDIHAGKFSRGYAESLGNAPLAFIEKRRPKPGEADVVNIIGEEHIPERKIIIVDDIIDTAKTTCNAAWACHKRGARNIWAASPHGVFSGDAFRRIADSPIERMFVSDSIHKDYFEHPKINVISIAGLLGEAILRNHLNESVSSLFED